MSKLAELQGSGHVYSGLRREINCVSRVLKNNQPLDPRPSWKLRNHSPDGFNWGYSGSGPAQLALALLLDATEDPELAQRHYQAYKFAHVAAWDDEWKTTQRDILEWLVAQETDDAQAASD